jgi:hypothetical protein
LLVPRTPAGECCSARSNGANTDTHRNNPIPFNYETVVGGEPQQDDTRQGAQWLSDAAIYQWDDEFGDVGEPNLELEKMLFDDENLQRVGGAIKALSYDVSTEGPEKIHPILEVSYSPSESRRTCANTIAVR